jgi:hypothetical protein
MLAARTVINRSRHPNRSPSIPSNGSARKKNPGDDLFHEPEAHPKNVIAGVPPEATLRGRHPTWADTPY